MAKSASKRWLSNGTTAGLLCALVGPYLTYLFLNSIYGPTQLPGRIEVGLVLHWINLAALILIIFLVERRSLASIGGQSLRWWTVPFGALAGVAIIVLSGVLTQAVGLGADTAYVAYLQSLPFVLRVLLTMTAGIFEAVATVANV